MINIAGEDSAVSFATAEADNFYSDYETTITALHTLVLRKCWGLFTTCRSICPTSSSQPMVPLFTFISSPSAHVHEYRKWLH